ncbi:hypothetical protein [Bacillus sp. FSL K6-3431]|uniref:hypothetical protein n=1 Tax=Bacillus sp. FSL K6-3431 TaxID=2921500 RepID=UPI0030F5A786
MKIDIPSPKFLAEMSNEGVRSFEKDVLEGPLFRKTVLNIEEAALEGYTGYRHRISSSDDMRELEVIVNALKEAGYYCEIETKTGEGWIGKYNVRDLVISWDEEDLEGR